MSKETKLIYAIFKQIVNDLHYKLYNDFDNIIATARYIRWEQHNIRDWTIEELEQAKKEEDTLPEKCKTLDKSISLMFKNLAENGTRSDRDRNKNIYVFEFEAYVNDNTTEVTVGLAWYDFLRPTVLKALWMLRRADLMRKSHDMVELDKALATINPNRIELILLGEKREQKDK